MTSLHVDLKVASLHITD